MIMVLERHRQAVWIAWLIAALLFLQAGNLLLYGIAVPASAGLLVLLAPGLIPCGDHRVDMRDVRAVLVLYVGVVTALSLAFRVFTVDNTLGLFVFYATGMLLGVVGPVVYTVWRRGRSLADLGLRLDNWREAVALGLALATVQFFLTLYGYGLPEPVDWVPLAVMALMVGLFEAVFFRGFIQTRLSASFGPVGGVGAAAGLYALYHVGYGMGPKEMVFLFGLGVVYAVAYACVTNILVLWPLLLPMGSFFNNLEAAEITMPWAAILGFADILAVMLTAVWIAYRRGRRAAVQSVEVAELVSDTTPAVQSGPSALAGRSASARR
jgi:membrane protease YdiL (CAAX protease family)